MYQLSDFVDSVLEIDNALASYLHPPTWEDLDTWADELAVGVSRWLALALPCRQSVYKLTFTAIACRIFKHATIKSLSDEIADMSNILMDVKAFRQDLSRSDEDWIVFHISDFQEIVGRLVYHFRAYNWEIDKGGYRLRSCKGYFDGWYDDGKPRWFRSVLDSVVVYGDVLREAIFENTLSTGANGLQWITAGGSVKTSQRR